MLPNVTTPGFEGLPNIPDALRGTYAGAALMAPYLKALGVSVIELLPVHETDSDQVGAVAGTTNHWGYQTLAFFAPNRDYSSDKGLVVLGSLAGERLQVVLAVSQVVCGVVVLVARAPTRGGGRTKPAHGIPWRPCLCRLSPDPACASRRPCR